jgi:hypothetical protein
MNLDTITYFVERSSTKLLKDLQDIDRYIYK